MAYVQSRFVGESLTNRLKFLVGVSLSLTFLFVVVFVRQQCLRTGYEISSLAHEYDKRLIRLQELEMQKMRQLSIESLFKRADELGFKLPGGEDIYYVR